ncbi:YncE family protein [Streptomyces sp. WAC05374]|uniref:YncE family protein n=1 Tax=Streptomyces sp. WAC05374 TaxID=2487420 RepID=UPI000F888B17|nr:PQQ-binding-like beta-propeller repeat protein [Streptomyces sp. WAC05374]RST10490.1 YncE family protein [Streptomyces sp. WAC05374]TDF40291.1 YncE family protein [Streptomyces sp. WAC05374]TDF53481.1 YncE family protein [Streptomyces sp. WAC05374]TDF59328.1 YncE family protein [Streptomyces sp. WAC05374]
MSRLPALLALTLTLALGSVTASAAEEPRSALRDVVVVGNSADGTVSFIDSRTYENLGSLDVVPDLDAILAGMDPIRRAAYEVVRQQAGGDKFVDDAHLSADGRTLYVSRGNLGDAAAYDIASGRQLWRTHLDGLKADHAALSPDGRTFVVSAITAAKAQALDTATGRVTGEFPTGTYPHENMYSADGSRLYNMSIGVTSLPKALNALKGAKRVTVADAATLKVLRTYTFDKGVRPAVITPDGRTMYAQLSYLNGFIEYDLEAGRTVRTVEMPFSAAGAALKADDYPQNSAHHGMAMNGANDKLCVAGTIDDYTAVVSRPGLTTDGFVHYEPGALPYWSLTAPGGTHCFVTLSNRDEVSVVDYRTAREVARVQVGDFPQRERAGRVAEDALPGLSR